MKKKFWLLLALAMFVVVGLTACGSDNNDDNNDNNRRGNDDNIIIVTTPPPPSTIAVHRWINLQTKRHFWTHNVEEIVRLPSDWKHEGFAFNVLESPQPGAVAVHRFYNLQTNLHFWSFDPAKSSALISATSSIWLHDGLAFHVYSSQRVGAIPLHLLVNNFTNEQFLTSSNAEKEFLLLNFPSEWRLETIAAFVPVQ